MHADTVASRGTGAGLVSPPVPVNEPVLSCPPGTPERDAVTEALGEVQAQEHEIPLIIG